MGGKRNLRARPAYWMAVALCLLVLSGVLAARSADADVTGSPEPLTSTSRYTQMPARSTGPVGRGTVTSSPRHPSASTTAPPASTSTGEPSGDTADPTGEPASPPAVSTPAVPGSRPTDQAVPVVTQTVLVVGTGDDGGSGAATISAIGSLLAGLAALATFGHTLALSRDRRRSSSASDSAAAPSPDPDPDPRPDTPA